MAEQDPPKNRRLVPWNPDEDPESGSRESPSGTSGPGSTRAPLRSRMKWVALTVAALIIVVLAWRLIVVLPEFFPEREDLQQSTVTEVPQEPAPAPTGSREDARRAADQARALRDSVRLEAVGFPGEGALLEVERLFVRAERAMDRREFAEAEGEFRRAMRDLESLRGRINAWQRAGDRIDRLEEALGDETLVAAYAPPEFRSLREEASRARTLMDARDYLEAADVAGAALDRLIEARISALSQLEADVRRGQQALAAGDGATARTLFEEVLAIDPENEAAVIGLQRAPTIGEVAALMGEGRAREEAGDLRGALDRYRAAAELDPYAVDARQAASAIRRALRDRTIAEAFNVVARLIQEDRWNEAERILRDLRTEYPEDARVVDRLQGFEEARRLNRVRIAVIEAREAESRREWERARSIYRDLIDMGVDRSEVVAGYERTGRVLRAVQAFSVNMRLAREASDRGDYQEAISRFNEAMESRPEFLELNQEERALRDFLEGQSNPVPVTFQSDGRTMVSWIGPMNRPPTEMDRQETVQLLPGRYRVRGTRMGYRPVEFELQVRGHVTMEPVRVIAHERQR